MSGTTRPAAQARAPYGGRGGAGVADGGRGGRGGAPGRGGGAGRGGGGFAPPAVLSIPKIRSDDLPEVTTSAAVVPHLFGGIRRDTARTLAKPTAEEATQRREERAAATKKVSESLAAVDFIPKGSKGKASTVVTNNFPVTFGHNRSVYQYDVTIEPNVFHQQRSSIVRQALRDAKLVRDPDALVVRGAIAYSAEQLHVETQKKHEPRVLQYKPPTTARGVASKERTVTFTFTRLVSPPGNDKGLTSEWYAFVTTLLADALEDGGLTKIGGAYYDMESDRGHCLDGVHPGDGINLLTGLKVSLHPTERCGLMLAVDLATRVTRKGTVWDVLKEAKALGRNVVAAQQREMNAHVKGVMCVATYKTGNRRQTIRADSIRFDMTPKTLISLPPDAPANTKRQSYGEYLNTVHGIPLKDIDMSQPLIEHVSKKQVDKDGKPKVFHFLPQMLKVASQSEAVRNDFGLQQRIKKIALMTSEMRFNTINEWMQELTTSGMFHRLRQQWKLDVSSKFVEAPSRVLASPELFDGNGKMIPISGSKQWLVKKGMKQALSGSVPMRWTVVAPKQLEASVVKFLDVVMKGTISGLGAGWFAPTLHFHRDSRDEREKMKILKDEVLSSADVKMAQFVLIVLPSDSEEYYMRFKTEMNQVLKIPSQCVLQKNVMNEAKHLDVGSRVGGQMLVKAGGELWTQTGKDVPNSLIVGVATNKCGSSGAIVSVVACRGDDFRFVYEGSRVVGQQCCKGSGKALCEMIGEAAYLYRGQSKVMKASPLTNIVVYRSGMDEGSVPDVIQHEMVPLRELCTASKWKLCVVASLKRCLTRLYKPESGSVVDRGVLPNTGHTFMMVAHNANVGTATPMKYSVLTNDVTSLQRTGDAVQGLTHKLCHMFFGWWGSTREPSVVMYAQRHAELCCGLASPKDGIVIPKGCYSAL